MAVKTNAVKNRFDRKHFLSKIGRQKIMPVKNVCRQNLCLIENTSRQKMPVRNECRQILILLKTFYISYHYNSYILGAFEEDVSFALTDNLTSKIRQINP